MKIKIFNFLIGALAALTLGSCDGRMPEPIVNGGGEGSVSFATFTLRSDDAIKLVTNGSRADVDFSSYIISVYDKNKNALKYSWKYAEMPEIIAIAAGDYTLEVESHKIEKAQWEAPYFHGSKDFSVEVGKITDIGEIVCKFSSIRVSIVFGDDLLKVLGTNAVVNVKANDAGSLDFTPGETRSGYFEAIEGSNTMIVTFNGMIDGVQTSALYVYNDVKAGEHRVVTLHTKNNPDIPEQKGSIDAGTSGIGLDVTFAFTDVVGNVTVGEETLPEDDRPGKEDSIDPPKPSTEAATFHPQGNLKLNTVNNPENFNGEPGTAAVTIKCPKGIAHLEVTIQSPVEAALPEMGLASHFDLAEPGQYEEALKESLGLKTGDEIKNQTEVVFDISTFVPLLAGFQGDHNFILDVTDNDGKKSSATLRFHTN